MTRSTDEWLMSRSCQSATFSNAARHGRTSRGEPTHVLAADRVALVRHGLEPFWPSATLLDLQDLGALERPNLHRDLLERGADDGEDRGTAPRGGRRCTTWVEIGSGLETEQAADLFLDVGSTWAKVRSLPRSSPPPPLLCPRLSRSMFAPASAYHRAGLRPKTIGFGMDTVASPDAEGALWARARRRSARRKRSRSASRTSQACWSWSASAVSRTSDEVMPDVDVARVGADGLLEVGQEGDSRRGASSPRSRRSAPRPRGPWP